MIKTGRYGQIKYDSAGDVSPLNLQVVGSLNTWKLSQKTDKINVTCFGDNNKKYVMGLKDISGSVGGFWNSDELTLFHAVDATEPGMLELIPELQRLGRLSARRSGLPGPRLSGRRYRHRRRRRAEDHRQLRGGRRLVAERPVGCIDRAAPAPRRSRVGALGLPHSRRARRLGGLQGATEGPKAKQAGREAQSR
jgi:hypothetical protein